ncbi:class I poly(R)-hydroxyalkanoic acid synthase [Azovibrio restrictus]|uniref:class I poly(R)-hydroxyalkanoic acid synthase n=1 Tax=Azovibrio restrictus TaxID=146938 RepID=UPI0026F1A1A0|nr:class I poly(R)-hydroxyalkanoic acid synthase [Azovibrio restrictus]
MSQAEGSNDALHPMFQHFIQAGQSMAQGFMSMLGKMPRQEASFPSPAQPALQTEEWKALQQEFMSQQARLWQSMLARSQGRQADFEVLPEPGDRRFAAPEWSESPVFDFIRQSYLLNVRYLKKMVETLPVEDERAREKLRFAARQYADALAPSNFAATNPEFIKLAVETKGKSITDGINNLIEDLKKGRISMTDESVFEVGRNLASTEGAVIFENELIQLIQYRPLTQKVAKRPLLVVPPCINKFYIMDLQPENSLIRFMVEQGHTVFLVSWRNPKAEQGHWGWDDYLQQGPITAIRVVQEISRQKEINTLGFCVGGTLLTSALAVLAARGEKPAASLTLLTTLLDFSDTGEIGLFIDEQSLAAREATIGKGGLLQARELQNTFSALRPNDLIWNYVTSNYLKGQKPQPFDLLYWNSDSTNLPGPFACWYMRNLYHDNSLRIPGKLEMCGVRVDLGQLDMPVYLLATREDHIVPWHSAYLSTRLLSGNIRFVLGASGHIAGVINPASKNKRSYWVNEDLKSDAESWLAAAEEKKGSWWNDWALWLKAHGGGEKAAPRNPGNARYKPIEPAPGRYVKERAV